jgi:transposase
MDSAEVIGSHEHLRIEGLTVGHKCDGRGVYDKAKKAQLVALCQQPGVSIAQAALANGIDMYLLRMWITKSQAFARRAKRLGNAATPVPSNALIPVSVPQFTTLQAVPAHEIELVLPRGLLRVARVDSAMLSQLIEALR